MKARLCIPILFLAIASISGSAVAQTIVAGSVSGLWRVQESPYIAVADIDVPEGEALLIDRGVLVLFRDDASFTVYGRLTAAGAEDDSIVFRPDEDFQRWSGLRFIDADPSRLDFCVLEFGHRQGDGEVGSPERSGGNLFAIRCDIIVEHSRLSNGAVNGHGAGFAIWNSRAEFSACEFSENFSPALGGGGAIIGESEAAFDNCVFVNNTGSLGGGAVALLEGPPSATFETCSFIGNTGTAGGAIALYGRRIEVYRSRFIGNHASMGGAGYLRNEGNFAIIEWCDFIENAADLNEGVGGALMLRFGIEAEIKYCRFIGNMADWQGGAFFINGVYRSDLHHNLFLVNSAQRGGGVFAVSMEGEDEPILLRNSTFIENRAFAEEGNAHIGRLPGRSRARISSSILWGPTPHFFDMNNVAVEYSNSNHHYEGVGNSLANPRIFEMDSSWCLLKGNSPCINSGDPELPEDPDDTRTDRGWLHYPENVMEGLESNEITLTISQGERYRDAIRFRNTTGVPVYVNTMDHWREGPREVMFNLSNHLGDSDIMAALWTNQQFIIAGGNGGRDPNKIYRLDRNLNLLGQFNQPGGVEGEGFLDMSSDGGDLLFAGDEEQIVEFTLDGEMGEQFDGPDGIRIFRGVGADFNYPYEDYDFYIGGDEGVIVRTDQDFWEQDRIEVGMPVQSLAVKQNSRVLYIVTRAPGGVHILSFVDPDNGKVIPLYPMMPPGEGAEIGGIEVTQDFREGRGSIVGIWKNAGEDADWLFVNDLYTSWQAVYPEWKLMMPGEEFEWQVVFAGDQVEPARYRSNLFLSINGYGEAGIIETVLNVTPASIEDQGTGAVRNFDLVFAYPNPFNSRTSVGFHLAQSGDTSIRLFNGAGREIDALRLGCLTRGIHRINWDATRQPAGAYMVILEQDGRNLICERLILVK